VHVTSMLLFQLDKERGAYGVKETLLAKVYVDLLKLGATSADAEKLKKFRAPKTSSADAGDFAAVLYSVIKDRCYGSENGDGGPKTTVADINDVLDALVAAGVSDGATRRRELERLLMTLFKKTTAIQQKWLVRMILKDVKFGVGQKGALDALHPDAAEFFDKNANLRKVCETLTDPKIRHNEISIELFSHFKPMLADRVRLQDIVAAVGGREFYLETKYDGERMQLHKNGDVFKFFSRNGFDFSDDFGKHAGEKFAAHVSAALASHVKSVILDGEICAYNYALDMLTQKGDQMNIRALASDDPVYQQCLYLYDVVFLNGRVLTNKPLKVRQL